MRYKLIMYSCYTRKSIYFLNEWEVDMYLQDIDKSEIIRADLFESDIKDICTKRKILI